jgi:Fe-Mn family superoxide dismutase
MLNRRTMMLSVAGAAATLALTRFSLAGTRLELTLPELPYGYDALEPFIDAQTMTIHHNKHHAGYVAKLIAALKDGAPEWLEKPVEEIVANYKSLPESVQTAVRNNGGGHFNHTLFWSMMAPEGDGGTPSDELSKAIDVSFGDMDKMKEKFASTAGGQFGSGWGWLTLGNKGKLAIVGTANQDNPVNEGMVPLLGVDVWEHAYYLKYQNKRADYIAAWFNVVNWNRVNELFAAAGK